MVLLRIDLRTCGQSDRNGLKAANDAKGHAAEDEPLRAVAACLRAGYGAGRVAWARLKRQPDVPHTLFPNKILFLSALLTSFHHIFFCILLGGAGNCALSMV